MALKKAYADIILNTAKEAAARIMVSERKAMRCQQELFAAKEDALRMLIRLKQMLDAKVFLFFLEWDRVRSCSGYVSTVFCISGVGNWYIL